MKTDIYYSGDYTITRHDSAESLERLRPEWNRLFERSDPKNPFMRQLWYDCWLEKRGGDGSTVFSVCKDGDTVAIVPVHIGKKRLGPLSVRTIEPFFRRRIDYNDLFVERGREEAVWAVFDCIENMTGWDIILWPDVRPGSAAERCLQSKVSHDGRGRIIEGMSCVHIPIGVSFDDFLKSGGTSRRDYARKNARRAQKVNGLRTVDSEEFSSSPSWIDRCIEVERHSFKGREGTGIFSGGEGAFFTEVFRRLAAERRISFCGAAIADTLLAFTLGFREEGTCYQYVTAYRQDFSIYYLGIYAHFELIKNCYTLGNIDCIDLLRGAEPFKAQLSDTVNKNRDFLFFRNRRYLMAWELRRSVMKRLPWLSRRA